MYFIIQEYDMSKQLVSQMKSKWPKLMPTATQNDEQNTMSKNEDINEIPLITIESKSSIINCPRNSCSFETKLRSNLEKHIKSKCFASISTTHGVK